MNLTPAERDRLSDYQTMMGDDAGRLAFVLDSLTDVMAMLGQHKVYCRVEKGPRSSEPPLDVAEALATLQRSKTLVQETMARLRNANER